MNYFRLEPKDIIEANLDCSYSAFHQSEERITIKLVHNTILYNEIIADMETCSGSSMFEINLPDRQIITEGIVISAPSSIEFNNIYLEIEIRATRPGIQIIRGDE